MTNLKSCKIVFGAAGPLWREHGPEVVELLREAGIQEIDVAQVYLDSERVAGEVGASQYFALGTKELGCGGIIVGDGPATKANVIRRALHSFDLLKTDHVDIFYIHGPDRNTPFVETLDAINTLYQMGKFRRFGLSNFLPQEVHQVVRICRDNGFVLPTVYEGNYSPIARKPESVLFPLLRDYGMTFYAYSPLAGGFLAKSREAIVAKQCPKFDQDTGLVGLIYATLYNKPSHLDALDEWNRISVASGIPQAELAYRWVAFHSPLDRARGDAMIFGASSVDQLRATLDGLKRGPLPADVSKAIDKVWEIVKMDAGFDNYNLNTTELAEVPDFKELYDKAHESKKFPVQEVQSQTAQVS